RKSARAARTAATRTTTAIEAAIKGWCVANHVNPTATTSSVLLSAIFDTGSGLGVTTARNAVFELCVASATAAPAPVAIICILAKAVRSHGKPPAPRSEPERQCAVRSTPYRTPESYRPQTR